MLQKDPPLQPHPNPLIYPMLDALRNCLMTQLVKVDNPVCHLPIIWGDSPLPAQRCDCTCSGGGNGEGWVRVVRFDQVGARQTSSRFVDTKCGLRTWDTTIETGVWRCAPTFDATTNQAPSDADYDAHTNLMLNDSAALVRAWRCCDWFDKRDFPHQADTVVPSGPSGGCVGIIATGRVRFEECYPCP